MLDLVNTISWRGEPARSQDHLHDAADCLTWANRAGVLDRGEAEDLARRMEGRPAAAAALTAGLRTLRSMVSETVLPVADHPERAEQLIQEAVAHSHLAADTPAGSPNASYHWTVTEFDEHTARRRLTLDLLELLTTPQRRIGVCADPQCQWVFLDTSHAQNRQWCSSQDCGNRHRVRRHQQRQDAAHQTAGQTSP
ncbi:MAG: CGNR zinc finger domain-containing protein [Marmoricola sp.]